MTVAAPAADLLATIVAATRRIVEVRQQAEPLARWRARAEARDGRRRGRFEAALVAHRPGQRDRRVQAALAVARRAARPTTIPVAIAQRLRRRPAPPRFRC